MRKVITMLCVLAMLVSQAQSLNYFRVEVGPKFDRFTSSSSDVNTLFKTDVAAGFFLGKYFTKSAFAELGVVKHDYASKLEISTTNRSGDELLAFNKRLLPSFNSLQLSLIGGYKWPVTERFNVLAKGGFQLMLKKDLKNEGSVSYIAEAKNIEIGYAEPISITVFANGFQPGNLIFRGDIGANYYVGNGVFMEASISGRMANNDLSQYQVEYESQSMDAPERVVISNIGQSLGFYLGLRYQISSFRD